MDARHAMKNGKRLFLAAIFLSIGVAGCAEKGPILLSVSYQAPASKPSLSPSPTVIVSPFIDSRGVAGSLVGKRVVSSGLKNNFVIQATASDLVTSALKEALSSRGANVKTGAAWNGKEQTIPAGASGTVIGGEITAFWLDSVSVPFKTTMRTEVRLTVVAGDIATRKIIRTLNVDSKAEQETLYSEEKLNSILSEALSSALDQIFQDDVIRQKLQKNP